MTLLGLRDGKLTWYGLSLSFVGMMACHSSGSRPAASPAAQVPSSSADTTTSGQLDLDGDGTPDRWQRECDSGSGFGGCTLKIELGNGRAFVLEASGPLGAFLTVVTLPPEIDEPSRMIPLLVPLLSASSDAASGSGSGSGSPANGLLDDSFAWLLENVRTPWQPAHAPFEASREFSFPPAAHAPTLPTGIHAITLTHGVDDALGAAIYAATTGDGDPDEFSAQTTQRADGAAAALVLYYARNHGPWQTETPCGQRVIKTTSHGVVWWDKSTDRSTWIYIADNVQKLRWPTIKRVACAADMVVVETDMQDAGARLVVAWPLRGKMGELALTAGASWSLNELTTQLAIDGVTWSEADLLQAAR